MSVIREMVHIYQTNDKTLGENKKLNSTLMKYYYKPTTMYSLEATNSTVPLHSSGLSSASLLLPSGPRLQWYSRGVSSVKPEKEMA